MATTTPLQAIANVREDRLHASTTSYPDSVGIKHYNRSRNKVLAKMRMLDDEYFWEEGFSDTVIGQREYEAKVVGTTTQEAITRVKKVFIKYSSTDEYYTECTYRNPDSLEYDRDYYADKQSKSDPFYFIQDNSVWIFPASTEAVTAGYKIECIVNPQALITSDTADKVQVPDRIQELIEDGMVSFGLEYLGKPINEAITQEQLFEKRLKDAMGDLSVRGKSYVQQGNPVLTQAR